MQLRYLNKAALYKITKEKQPNGSYINRYNFIKMFSVQEQEISDEISVSIYGADLNRIIRIKSINSELEKHLKPKMVNESDNISKYIIVIDDLSYSIKTVKSFIDIMLVGRLENKSL